MSKLNPTNQKAHLPKFSTSGIFENFIYTNNNAMSEEMCKESINFTNSNLDSIKEIKEQIKFTMSGIYPTENPVDFGITTRTDFNYFWSPYSISSPPQVFVKMVVEIIMAGLKEYVDKFPAMAQIAPRGISFGDIKYHIVESGEGYHAWHSEWNLQSPSDNRILVWHISLTTHEKEGELEFLYHNDRIPAKEGRLIIWPAFWPWVHRGNAIRTDTEKHYLTGWFHAN